MRFPNTSRRESKSAFASRSIATLQEIGSTLRRRFARRRHSRCGRELISIDRDSRPKPNKAPEPRSRLIVEAGQNFPMRTAIPLLIIVWAVLCGVFGCATSASRPSTCAVILLVDGKHVLPSQSQFAVIERRLSPDFARRQLTLVYSPDGAANVATIQLVSNPDAPELANLVVRDISTNSYVAHRSKKGIPAGMPSLRAAELEHQKAISGFTVD